MRSYMSLNRDYLPHIAGILFFSLLLGLGVLIHSHYGVSWDEPTQLDLGIKNYRYLVRGDQEILGMRDRWYGPAFELFLVFTQNRTSDRLLYLSRHLLTFLTFWLGCIALYFLGKRLTGNPWVSLVGTICFVLSPRIFADAFYNSKDIPFLVFYTFSLLSLLLFLDRPNLSRLLLHGMVSAALISIRIPGIFIPGLTLIGMAVELNQKNISMAKAVLFMVLYSVVIYGGCYLDWPALRADSWMGPIEAFRFMSQFPHETGMLYLGQIISSLDVPWHYIPVWMAVTTPVLYLLAFLIGLFILLKNQLPGLQDGFTAQLRDEFLILLAFLGPLLTVIAMNSVLYDAWR